MDDNASSVNGRSSPGNFEVPEDYDYAVVVEYHNHKKTQLPVTVEIVQEENVKLLRSVTIHSCPFALAATNLIAKKEWNNLSSRLQTRQFIEQSSI
ncbi:hypothetical protein TELCIR_02757 [Teladorsagia circumcincta]|uniref:Uncharacterized protein n=1 Tax=Teladorsagia circumcincta TaxID=45464 RepID=A0A2G9UY80_TELCI|nr:hypothetical protein TELCIR_02757 [Teladorsagia circumcincta]